MTGGFFSAAIGAPLMLFAAGAFVYWITAKQDRHDAANRGGS